MTNDVKQNKPTVNKNRRTLLQGAACVGVASFAPAVLANTITKKTISSPELALSGELVCSISNPVKTLVLRNNTDQAVTIDRLSQSALMFDGSIVDCNTAFLDQDLTIPANQEIQLQFDKRQQSALTHIDNFQRIQSRVTRRHDGTRVIPFKATLRGRVATLV